MPMVSAQTSHTRGDCDEAIGWVYCVFSPSCFFLHMNVSRPLMIAALPGMLALSSCAVEEQEPQQEVQPIASVTYEVPQPFTPRTEVEGCWEGNTDIECPILIHQDGSLTNQGAAIEPSDIDAIKERRRKENVTTILSIAIHPSAEFSDVVQSLSNMFPYSAGPMGIHMKTFSNQDLVFLEGPRPEYELVELVQYRTAVEQPAPEVAARFAESGFAGKVDELALPVWVGYSKKVDACIVKALGDEALAAQDFDDIAFKHLEGIVQHMGGPEEVENDPSTMGRLIARIQSEGDTPWRCIAAVVYTIESAGWPVIRFEEMAPAQAPEQPN